MTLREATVEDIYLMHVVRNLLKKTNFPTQTCLRQKITKNIYINNDAVVGFAIVDLIEK